MSLGPIEKLSKMDREKENRSHFNQHPSQSENYPHHD
jgi:hypothetical protein